MDQTIDSLLVWPYQEVSKSQNLKERGRSIMKPSFLSEIKYLVSALIGLALVSFILYCLLYPVNDALATDLLANAIFAGITIAFLDTLLGARERRQKKALEMAVVREIGMRLYDIYMFLRILVNHRPSPKKWSRKTFYDELEDFNGKVKVELSGFRAYFLDPSTWEMELEVEEFFESLEDFRGLATTFYDITEPELHISLLEIRRYVKSMSGTLRYVKVAEGMDYDDVEAIFDTRMPPDILGIIKQIHRIHETGMEIYYGPSGSGE